MYGATMNRYFTHLKKLAGLGVMATLVTTAGWGLAAGTAQADVGHPDGPGCFTWCSHDDHDRNFDRDRGDRDFFDRDRNFFDRDHDFFVRPIFPFFGGDR